MREAAYGTPGLTQGLPRVVHATGATAGRPYMSSRLADDEKSCASCHAKQPDRRLA